LTKSRHLHHALELAPLVVHRQRVAVVGAREAALRAQAQLVQRHDARRLVDAPFQVVLVLELAELGGHQAEHDLLAGRQRAQRLEAAGARAVELHEPAVDRGREHRLDHRVVAALGDPGALEVAAAGVDRDRHVGRPVAQRGVDDLGVAARQRRRVVAVGAAVGRTFGSHR
jgi:hypothetical protein